MGQEFKIGHKAGFVGVIGRPNVGKSTLVNEMVGQKVSITSHRPQTTRHRIHAIETTDAYQMVFVDTPGMHIGNKRAINGYMNRAASGSVGEVDVVLWVIEVGKWTREDERVLEHVRGAGVPVIVCVNKIDKLRGVEGVLPFLAKIGGMYEPSDFFPMSAFKKSDTGALRALILKYLPEGEVIFDADIVTDRSERFVVGEFIREKLMRHLGEELPYELTVEIEGWEVEGDLVRIGARILVERESQKRIVIGSKGGMLKLIGTEARRSIEGFLGRKVYLRLWVKVVVGWSDSKRALAELGYD